MRSRFSEFQESRVRPLVNSHRAIHDNRFLMWWEKGEINQRQMAQTMEQMAGFSRQFPSIQVMQWVYADNSEAMDRALNILLSELGVGIDLKTGSCHGKSFSPKAVHFYWLLRIAERLGIPLKRFGHIDTATPATLFFINKMKKTIANPDGQIGCGASWAIETWAGWNIGKDPESERLNFWKKFLLGFEVYNINLMAQGLEPLPIDYFSGHFGLERAHAANVMFELEETFYTPEFDQDKFMAGAEGVLEGVIAFFDGLDQDRQRLA